MISRKGLIIFPRVTIYHDHIQRMAYNNYYYKSDHTEQSLLAIVVSDVSDFKHMLAWFDRVLHNELELSHVRRKTSLHAIILITTKF